MVGIVTAVAGLVTVVPDFEAVEMVFGLGSIVWFIGVGIALRRTSNTVGGVMTAVRRRHLHGVDRR